MLKKNAVESGMRPLRHDGWEKIKSGVTTIDEVLRVTLEDEIMTEERPQAVIPAASMELESAGAAPVWEWRRPIPQAAFRRARTRPAQGRKRAPRRRWRGWSG